jgi:hypothetical protein
MEKFLSSRQERVMSAAQSVRGTIITRRFAVGSKSEKDGYILATDDGKDLWIELRGDNPFEQPTLRKLVGRRCQADGTFYNGKFLAKTIVPLP